MTFERTGATIYIWKHNGWYIIYDDVGNVMRFLYYSRREALRRFKEEYGYRYARGIKLVDR